MAARSFGMRLASGTPVRCSSCFGQKPDSPHVDFESSYDGPPIDQSNPRAGHVDWVVMCADCVETAHSLLPEVRDIAAELHARIARLEEELADVSSYADKLEAAVTAQPEREHRAPRTEKAGSRLSRRRYEPREVPV